MKDINAIMRDINKKLTGICNTLTKTKEYYKNKLKELFLNDFDAYYEYIKDEIKEEENNENEGNEGNEETNNNKKKKKIFSFSKKLKKNKNKKDNDTVGENSKDEINDNNTNTNEKPTNNDQLVNKEDITDLTNLLMDEEKLKKEIEEYEIDVNKEKFAKEIVKRYNDKFIPIMETFYHESSISYEKLKNLLKEANDDFSKLCQSFGEDPESTEPSELFTLFNDFWDQFLVK